MKPILSCVVLMLAAGASMAQTTGLPGAKPLASSNKIIESYVAPQEMFPVESQYKRPPIPLLAYDRPQGHLIGTIQLEKPHCLLASNKDSSDCQSPLGVVFKPSGKVDNFPVEIAQWGYETMGMVSYAPAVKRGLYTWSKVEHEKGSVWVPTQADDVHPYENVAYLVQDIREFCLDLAKSCAPVTPQAKAEMQRLANLITCYETPYTIVERLTYNGKRYYKLDIDSTDEHPTTLPHPVYVPTRNADGSHTGDFYARGC